MSKPKGDLGSLAMPKGGEAQAPREAPTASRPTVSLTLKVTEDEYAALRDIRRAKEDAGERVTHQAILRQALVEFLERNGG